MAYVIKNNMDSVNALKNLSENTKAQHKSLQKAASGEKITSAGDGASEYAISERMRVQVKSLDQDDQNAQNGISILNVAAGAIDSTIDVLRTMKEKAIDAANDSNSDDDRAIIQKAINEAIKQIDDNALVSYNGITMLDGSFNNAVVEGGTYTHLTNEQLCEDTTKKTSLIELKDRTGNSLGISKNDRVVLSWVKNGETVTKEVQPLTFAIPDPNPEYWDHDERWRERHPEVLPTIEVEKAYTLETLIGDHAGDDIEIVDGSSKGYSYIGTDEAGEEVKTVDGGNALTIKATEPGISGQIAGFTIAVYDTQGKVLKSATNALDNFMETIPAQNASEDNALVFQIGTKANQSLKAGFRDMRSTALGLRSPNNSDQLLSVATQANANAAVNVLDNALQKALDLQTKIGAETSRLEYTSANLVMNSENTQAAESVIRDADMAKEQTAYARDSILTQAAQAMLAQSNQNSSSVLSLLQ